MEITVVTSVRITVHMIPDKDLCGQSFLWSAVTPQSFGPLVRRLSISMNHYNVRNID